MAVLELPHGMNCAAVAQSSPLAVGAHAARDIGVPPRCRPRREVCTRNHGFDLHIWPSQCVNACRCGMPHAAIAIGSAERVCTWIAYTAVWRRRQAVRCLWSLFHGVIGRQRLRLRHGQIFNSKILIAARPTKWMR